MKNLFETTDRSPERLTPAEKAEMITTDLRFQFRRRISSATQREYHRILY